MKKTFLGFTLLETLVAVAVLLMALLGPFSIAQQSLRSAYYARDQITAYYLAQEGIEYVRAQRDQNYLSGSPWLNNITSCVDTPCTVDMTNFDHSPCPLDGCPPLLVSTSGGLFNQSSGDESKFTRSVRLITVPDMPEEMIISVTISWVSSGISRTFSLQERIFNWL